MLSRLTWASSPIELSAVVPGVRIGDESAVTTCWHKEAKSLLDAQGRRIAWSPPVEGAA